MMSEQENQTGQQEHEQHEQHGHQVHESVGVMLNKNQHDDGEMNHQPQKKKRARFQDLFERQLPRRAKSLCCHSMVAQLDVRQKKLVREYIIERCPGSAEIADILFWVADNFPQHLRTKELCETIEAVTLIGAKLFALRNADESRKTNTVYDLACGHGLGGFLLAYRFPETKVIGVDISRRPCWASYREAFEKFGKKAPGNETVMQNLVMEERDLATIKPIKGDFLVCLHGCNELSPMVIDMARKCRTGCGVMPCCLRDGLLGVSTSSGRGNWGHNDDIRYSLQVGVLAGKSKCSKVASISSFITNRYLMIISDFAVDAASENEVAKVTES